MSLLDLIAGNAGNQVAQRAENKFGISKNQIIALLAVAAPVVISYLKNKTKDKAEAESLSNALDKDHDGSILNDLSQIDAREQEGSSILDHIFGSQKTQVENQLSQNTGISMDKIGPILSMLAPVIMGYIGNQKQSNHVDSGGIGDLLGGILGQAQQQAQGGNNPLNDILGQVLGSTTQNSSSNPLEDLLGGVLASDTKEQNKGGLGGLLGSILGRG
ncbi:DUF937 domain-containing protein [Chryseobacterium sp. A321]